MRHSIVILVLALASGCSSEVPAPATSDAATAEGAAEVTSVAGEESEPVAEVTDETFVIDVRTKSEWDSGHVDEAVHIPHTEIGERISEVTTDKDAKIVVYCAVGGRAGQAKESLEKLGFTNVENGGGYDDVKERF